MVANTSGRVSGETGKGASAKEANPVVKTETPKEKSWWGNWGEKVHTALDIGGAIPVVGIFSDAINAGIYTAEGNYVEAAISGVSAAANLIPGGGIAAKGGKIGLKVAEEAAKKTAKEAAKHAAEEAAKESAKAAAKKKAAEEAAAEASKKAAKDESKTAGKAEAKAKGDTKVKPKKKLKCGEFGKYGNLKKKTGDGKFDRDHIPSKSALKEKALELNKGKELSTAQQKAIDAWGNAIAIPRQAHIDISPTYGGRSNPVADAKDLAGSARRDVEEMLGKIHEYDADGGCKKAYQKAAKRVLKSNAEFEAALKAILKSTK
jgi:hypothetical protein